MPAAKIPLEIRFWSKIVKTDDCWLWTAGTHDFGYGRFNIDKQVFYAHRVSWELANGPVPKGMVIRHRCDNAGCVRPDHLELGTAAENLADSRARGRWHNRPERKRPKRPRRPRGRPLVQRFWEKVDIAGPADCWLWRGARNVGGYGLIWINEKNRKVVASRVAYELESGPIPTGLIVRHSCDNPPCVNPAHLLIGTKSDNVRDRTERNRGREQHGEKNSNAKLTDTQVAEIRSRYTGAWGEQSALAREYGVGQAQIWRIVRGIQRSV